MAQNNNYNKYLEEKYQYFILGKLAFHEKDKKKSFQKCFKELHQLYLDYSEKNKKYNKIKNFIDIIITKNYFKKDELNLIRSNDLNQNRRQRQLEKIISIPYKKCKEYFRKFERIKYIREKEPIKILKREKK